MKAQRLASALAFLFLWPAGLHAEWQVQSLERKACAGEAAAEYRHYSLGRSDSENRVALDLFVFSAQKPNLRVIDQPDFASDLTDVIAKTNAVAGVNGGYFDPDGKPVGLLRSDNRQIAPLQHARLLGGVLAVDASGVKIFRASVFPRKHAWRDALQCGPFLVEGSRAVTGLNDSRSARRTFVALTSDRRALLGDCDAATLAQLAEILTSLPGIKVTRAMNLDGGSSSAFWCRTTEGVVSIRESKRVRDFVIIAPGASR